jgi:hypothetical protein
MTTAALATLLLAGAAPVAAIPGNLGGWSSPSKLDEIDGNNANVNTPSLDGCPIQSPDGRYLFMASNRPRFAGDTRTDLDIWVAHRTSHAAPWSEPVNMGPAINSSADDFCPTPIRGNGLLFVSRRTTPGVTCGMGDIYIAREHPVSGWSEPEHLGCAPNGPNTALDEQGPSLVGLGDKAELYYSSGPDIFVSQGDSRLRFGAGAAVAALNGPGGDVQPNVRRDGLEVYFASNDATRPGAQGGFDLYVASRASVDSSWGTPVNLGSAINTAANETRPSLSWQATQLLFGRAPGPEGNADIFVTTR